MTANIPTASAPRSACLTYTVLRGSHSPLTAINVAGGEGCVLPASLCHLCTPAPHAAARTSFMEKGGRQLISIRGAENMKRERTVSSMSCDGKTDSHTRKKDMTSVTHKTQLARTEDSIRPEPTQLPQGLAGRAQAAMF